MNNEKGVVCRVEEPENMPVDADGNVADIISSPDSIPGRMNLGRLYAPYIAGASRDIRKLILEQFGFERNRKEKFTAQEILAIPEARYNQGIATLLHFYSIVSPRMKREFTQNLTDAERIDWLLMALNETSKDAMHLNLSIEMDEEAKAAGEALFLDEMVERIERDFGHALVYGPVTYVGRSGERVTTKNKFRIAPLYFMLLDKIADGWLSADIGKRNNFGLLAAMNRTDKFSTPWRKTTPRTIGETEGRLDAMYGGREMTAELLDRNGSIITEKEIAEQLIRAEHPTQVENLVDRNKIPLGEARQNQMLHHIFQCIGFDIVYAPEKKGHQ